jgi:Icc-related predicted phosphoesterase
MVKDDIGFFDKNVRSEKYHKFFQECGERFPHVIYVMGNHEHYNGDYRNTITTLRDRLSYIRNLHILDKDTFVIDDVTFIGGTLWTDMNKEDPITLMQMSGMMNDFRCVDNSHRMVNFKAYEQIHGVDNREKPIFKQRAARFTPEDAVEDHKQMMDYIRIMIEGKWDQKFVVVGHHAPSKQSTHPRYKEEVVMNGGYSSDLDDFIIDHPQIKLWTHGHTHEDFDYMIGSTRIVCNPRGYIRYEDRADRFELKFLEI